MRAADDDLEDHYPVRDVPVLHLDGEIRERGQELVVVDTDLLAPVRLLLPCDIVEPRRLAPRPQDRLEVMIDLGLNVLLNELDPRLEVDG
jgi:hypothetical protein